MFWGLSEALDLLDEYLSILKPQDWNAAEDVLPVNAMEPAINILIFGSNDPRHILKTMAKMYTHCTKGVKPNINLYVLDGCVEILARNLALLGIALESSNDISLNIKVQLFMDIYGNSLIRPFSQHYLIAKSKSMLNIVTDSDYLESLVPFLNLDGLKYRERDGLENVLNFWLPKEGHVFNMQEYWTSRIRKLLATRFDYREGKFDWDLNMILKDRGAAQICSQEYRHWRETGIAFTFPEFEYSKVNKTLAAGLVRNGEKYVHRGYLGDIQTGPFIAYGLQTSEQRMLKSVHGENDYRATDITERNLLELFHELATQTSYEHDLNYSRKYGAVRLKMGKSLTCSEYEFQNTQHYNEPWINIPGINIHFISSDDIFNMQQNNSRWKDFFDLAFVSHNYFEFLKDSFEEILRAKSVLIMETKLFTTDRKDAVASFEQKLFDFAKRTKLQNAINYEVLNSKRSYLKFKKFESISDKNS